MWVNLVILYAVTAQTSCSFKNGNLCNSKECKIISVSVYNNNDKTVGKRAICSSIALSAEQYASTFQSNGDCNFGDTKEIVYTQNDNMPGLACLAKDTITPAPTETIVEEENTLQIALYIAGGSGFLLVFALFACMITGG